MGEVTRAEATSSRWREDALALLPAGVTLVVLLYWVFNQGGYESRPSLGGAYRPDGWYIGALAMVGLWCAVAIGLRRIRLSRRAAIACAALLAYTAWSFLSVLWAHDQGTAFLGSVRALVYCAAFATFALLPWNQRSLRIALGALVAAVGAAAVAIAVKVAFVHDPSGLYLDARLVYPLGYYNADAALLTCAAFVAVALAAQRSTPAPLRVGALVVAAACLQLAVLSQSRGWLFTLPVILVFALLLVPGRLRLLASALGPALATAAVAPALLRVYGRATSNGVVLAQPRLARVLHQQGSHAVRAMLIADAILALVAGIAVALDERVTPTERSARRANRAGLALAIAVALIGVALAVAATHGHPIARVERAWRSFASTSESGGPGTSRFASLGSQRADFWRVGLHEWLEHPLAGIGQDNFASSYLRLGHTVQEPRWVHSIELRLLVHTGLVGALLFALFLAATLVGALRGRWAGTPERVAGGIALLPLAVWLVHGSVDWLWEFPVLSVPALAFAAAATAIVPERAVAADTLGPEASAASEPTPRPDRRGGARWVPAARWGAVGVLGLGSLLAVAIPFAAARQLQSATQEWQSRPASAYARLRSAAELLPFDAQVDTLAGAIALDREEGGAARAWFARAQRLDDEEWLAPFVLGLLDGERGRRGRVAARAELLRARALNSHETLIAQALRRLRTAYPLTVYEAQEDLSLRNSERFG
jgi:O-antigen ligase